MSPLESPNTKALKLYLRYWGRFPLRTAMSLTFSLLAALQATIVPLIVALALGQLIREHTVNVGLLVFAGCFQLATIGLCYIFDVKGIAVLHQKVEKDLYRDSFEYLVHQDYGFFVNRFGGSLVTQASRFAKVYTVFNDTIFFDMLPQVGSVLIALAIMSYYSPLIGLAVLCLWLVSIYVVIRLALARLPMRRGAVAKESEQVGELADVITNALTLKTFAAEDREIDRYQQLNEVRGNLFLRSWERAVRNVWMIQILCAVLQLTVFIGGILAVQHHKLGIATFLLFQVYIVRIIDSISRTSYMVRQFEMVAGDAQEMTELLEQLPLVRNKPFTEKSKIKRGVINFKSMRFQYDDASSSGDPLFTDFNLTIKSGEKIGLVGPSGGGKTTITRLLLRFMDINDGAIVIDGQDIRDIKQQDLRRSIAYVPQEPLLFHRSIKDNIRYGKPGASDAEVLSVAKKSSAHDFIKDLPDGYDTLVGERGVKLSGGQRQRVAIARAMLTKAPILVLDEATSALDSQSEKLIQKALWELMKNKTAVVIAHRLSTINHMDRIVVLDKGKIIEQGTHKELLVQKGLYARLWSHQSGGFIESE